MTHDILLVVLGLVALTAGAEGLVRGGSRLALGLGLSPLFIGLTIVSYGTSAPEMVVSVLAAIRERPDIAVGNVVGSNIFNIAVVLGLSAVIAPLPCRARLLRRELPIVIAVTVVLLLFSLGGSLNRIESMLFLVALGAYSGWSYRTARQENRTAEEPVGIPTVDTPSRLASLGFAIGGTVLLVLGARWLVDGAADLARLVGISDAVIGLTVVATGTSLPELATSIAAALKRELDIAIGNILGSNIFNVLGILGITAAVHPVGIAPHLTLFDIPVALGFALVSVPMMMTGRRISRAEGLVLFLTYVAYIILLFQKNGPLNLPG